MKICIRGVRSPLPSWKVTALKHRETAIGANTHGDTFGLHTNMICIAWFRIGAIALLVFILAGCATEDKHGGSVAARPSVSQPMPAPIDPGLVRAAGFKPEQLGYVVEDLESGTTVAAHNAERAFIPASVAKLSTAVAALEVLGGTHRFTTEVRATGERRGAVLDGDMVLVGGGDPLLGPDDLMALCGTLRADGLRRVTGRLLYDARKYPRRTAIRATQPPDARYNPGVSALSLDFNRIRVRWRGGRTSPGFNARSFPPLPGLGFQSGGGVTPNGTAWSPEMGADRTIWRLSPDAADSGRAWLPMKRPARLTAQAFRRLCAQAGVDLPPPEAARGATQGRVLARHLSPPLVEITQAMLRYSNNLLAELLGLATTEALHGRGLRLRASADAVADWWRQRLPAVNWNGYGPGNHSGLNAEGRATPAQVLAMLRLAHGRRYDAAGGSTRALADLLPAAGWRGGLGERLGQPETALRVWAKTGTMNYASGLAGYLFTEGGRRLAFAIFVNDLTARKAWDAAPGERDATARQAVADWRERAKALEAELVRRWLRSL